MIFPSLPLRKCKITQPFGVDWVGDDFYRKLGLKGHNGTDFACPTGTEVLAVADGDCRADVRPNDKGYGVNISLLVQDTSDKRYEIVYGHLKEVVKTGRVKAEEVIGISDNTGLSTGPHLHLGVYVERGEGNVWYRTDWDNGYFGAIDPQKMFAQDAFLLPVEKRYGLKEADRGYSEIQWYGVALWFWKTFKRLPNVMEKNALIWGRWDIRSVMEPAMFATWSELTKPGYLTRKV